MTVKPGHRTTEFLLTVLTVLGSAAGAIGTVAAAASGTLPDRYAVYATAVATVAVSVSSAAYSIGRSLTKAAAGGSA